MEVMDDATSTTCVPFIEDETTAPAFEEFGGYARR